MFVLSNPGSGPVMDSQEQLAHAAVGAFLVDLVDLEVSGVLGERDPASDRDGRYAFTLTLGERTCSLLVPGRPLTELRYTGDHQNPFEFYRLFVDGSSWLWEFALTMAKQRLVA